MLLTLSMLLSMLVIPAAAADPISDYPDDLDAIVELLSGADGVDGESAFDYLGTVFLGWRAGCRRQQEGHGCRQAHRGVEHLSRPV